MKEAMKQALEALEDAKTHGFVYVNEIVDLRQAIAALEKQGEPVGWPCLIAETNFSQNTVTLIMQCEDYKVSAGRHWLSTTSPRENT
jgi:hypothetical protein